MTCNHTSERNCWFPEEDDGWSATPGHWECETYHTTVDLDTHRYKCTQCGEVMYYSGRARDYYEKGVKSWVPGLDK